MSNLNPKQFRFRRVDYKDSEGVQSHDFVLEHGKKKVIGGYRAPAEGSSALAFGLHSTPGSSAHVPAVMGAMAEHSQKTYGHVPEISADLSVHSARIANKLVDKGLAKIANDRDPSMGLSNVGFKEAKKTVKTIVNLTNKETEGVHELSREDERRGHEVVRSMLKKKK